MVPPRDITVMGERMKDARIRKNMSITKLSKVSGVHVHTISNAEKGHSSPTLLTAYTLADALGVSLGEYIGERKPRFY